MGPISLESEVSVKDDPVDQFARAILGDSNTEFNDQNQVRGKTQGVVAGARRPPG